MTKPIRWAYDPKTKRWTAEPGNWEIRRVEEGDHAGEHALTDNRGEVSYHASYDDARAFAESIERDRLR